jgi:hypothetical protein
MCEIGNYNMKEYTFEVLHRIIANIDYVWPQSFPIQFKIVQRDGRENFYEAGICNITDNIDYENVCGGDGQYLSEIEGFSEGDNVPTYICVLDLQDCDGMKFAEIGEMLKRECEITDSCSIFISDKVSRGGRMEFSTEDLSDDCIKRLEKTIKSYKEDD